jgi:hypothetical protein
MRDLERHLGVSYPTARARFDDLLRRLGLASAAAGASADAAGRRPVVPTEAERLATLRALAQGDLDVDEARTRLRDR